MYAVGVDLGATNLRVVVADENGEFLVKISEHTVHEGTGWNVTAQIIRMIKEALTKSGVDLREVAGIGVGAIGPLDLRRGVILKTPNLPFEEIPIVEPLEKEFGKPVRMLNDCTTAVVGEKHFGAGKGKDNIVYVTISTGIGGGAYVDGYLLLGKDGNFCEPGHTVIDPYGKLECSCGKRGHWEAYCSGRCIPRFVKLLKEEWSVKETVLKGDFTAKDFFDAVRQGDEFALKALKLIQKFNAIGFANIIDMYDPSLITVGGSVALNNKEYIIDPLQEAVKDYIINRPPEIKATPLGGDIVLYGAVALALGLEKPRRELRD